MMITVKGLVDGKVQGVWFRKYVQSVAAPLGISGYAKNLPDGRVEVVLCGEETAVNTCKALVEEGSPASQVESVCWLIEAQGSYRGFQIL